MPDDFMAQTTIWAILFLKFHFGELRSNKHLRKIQYLKVSKNKITKNFWNKPKRVVNTLFILNFFF